MTQVLLVAPPLIGGRTVGAGLAEVFDSAADVAVVEATDEDPAALGRAQVIFTGLGPVTAEHIAAADCLEHIQCASHGFDYVDLRAARDRAITVANIGTSAAERQDVAEHTFALILALTKQLVAGHVALARAEWALPRMLPSITELHGKTLGIIGFGHVGREVARRAAAFDMRIVYADTSDAAGVAAESLGARPVALGELLVTSDYVSVHTPLNDGTRGLIGAEQLALMKPTAFVVNTARGAIIDQDALADALEAGRIAGAGIDVFDPEPPSAELRLLGAPNVVLSPHVAGITRETLARIAAAAAANVRAHLAGAPVADVVS